MRIALGIEYDGSAFCGWQTQAGGCAAQDHLETALARIAGVAIETTCAGRTDSGVHALGQVVHFDTTVERPLTAWVRGTNAFVPAALGVIWARSVDASFHARYSARARCYRYLLLNRAVRPAADQHRVGWFHAPLDVGRMRQAARHLIGEHDFSAFRSSECQARSPVRTLASLEIQRRDDYLVFEITANAFLHHMVRNIVGSLVYVGSGRRAPDWLAQVLAGRDRRVAAPTFAASGLYLMRVLYDPVWEIPDATRATVPAAMIEA
jgi:tRNA pseudouridine38-40 synthase